jgi:hypothetical protein
LDRHDEAIAAYDKGIDIAKYHPSANFWRTQERIRRGAASIEPLPPVLGQMPDVARDDTVVFFAADSVYFWKYGLVLLESIGRNCPAGKCHLHLINPDASIYEAIEIVRGTLPQLDLSYSYERIDLDGSSPTHIRTYYASIRFVRLAEVFAKVPATYLCVDADCIVRKDIVADGFAAGIEDVSIRMRYDERPNMSVAAGALVLRPTAAAAAFIDRVGALIGSTLGTREAVWFLDQIVLSHVVRELGGEHVGVRQLDAGYIDWFFRDDSPIWTGKGKRKSEDTRYTSEVSRYWRIRANEEISRLMPQQT